MKKSNFRLKRHNVIRVVLAMILLSIPTFFAFKHATSSDDSSAATFEGTKIVIARFKGVDYVDPSKSDDAVAQDKNTISEAADTLSKSLEGEPGTKNLIYSYENFPLVAYEVDSVGEAALANNPIIESIVDDAPLEPHATIADPITAIGGTSSSGFYDGTNHYTGDGFAVVILDDGVDKNHSALQGQVIDEVCIGLTNPITYGDGTTLSSACPGTGTVIAEENGLTVYQGAGVASNCAELSAFNGCSHGTAVAAAAAMHPQTLPIGADTQFTSGSAIGAKIIAVQINQRRTSSDGTKGMGAYFTAELVASDMLLSYKSTFSLPVASVNYSYGFPILATDHATCASLMGSSYTDYYNVFRNLRAANVAPVISSGNNGTNVSHINTIGSPACVEGAIAVGATNTVGSSMAYYSNNAPIVTLLAPGGDMMSSNGGLFLPTQNANTFREVQGTSLAAPMVSGAFAVLREKNPDATVETITNLLRSTGRGIVDDRAGYNSLEKPLIQLNSALIAANSVVPIINAFSAPSSAAVGSTVDITTNVSNIGSCSIKNSQGATVATISTGFTTSKVAASTAYTLTCTNTVNSLSYEATRIINATLTAASSNNDLATLTVTDNGTNYLKGFNANTAFYDIVVPNSTESIEVDATTADASATIVSGLGNHSLSTDTPTIVAVEVMAQDGSSKVYSINITRKALSVPNTGDSVISSTGAHASSSISVPAIVSVAIIVIVSVKLLYRKRMRL